MGTDTFTDYYHLVGTKMKEIIIYQSPPTYSESLEEDIMDLEDVKEFLHQKDQIRLERLREMLKEVVRDDTYLPPALNRHS